MFDDVRSWFFVVLGFVLSWDADHGAICDLGVSEEETFELGRGDLKAADFDEFLWGIIST